MPISIKDMLDYHNPLKILNIHKYRNKEFGLIIDFLNQSRNLLKQLKALADNTLKMFQLRLSYLILKLGKITNYLTYSPMKSIRAHFKKLWLDTLQFLINLIILAIKIIQSIKSRHFNTARVKLNNIQIIKK